LTMIGLNSPWLRSKDTRRICSRNMSKFKRITGAQADVKELEYVAALHQTCLPETRENGTVSAVDVQRLLSSRYGLFISHERAVEIVRGLSGDAGYSAADLPKPAAKKKGKNLLRRGIEKRKNKSKKNYENPSENNEGSQQDKHDLSASEVSGLDQSESTGGDGRSSVKFNVLQGDQPAAARISSDQYREVVRDDDDNDNLPEEYFDIVQLVSLLLIPVLARAGKEFRVKSEGGEDGVQVKSENVDSQSLDPQPPDLILNSLRMILKDINVSPVEPEETEDASFQATSSSLGSMPVLDVELVEAILLEMGEYERAQDPKLMREMTDAASSRSGRFDAEALVNALTHDVREHWQVGSEDRLSTFFYDVFGYYQGSKTVRDEIAALSRRGDEPRRDEEDPKWIDDTRVGDDVGGRFDFKSHSVDHTNVDFVVDAHSSASLVVLIWLFYILLAATYASLIRGSIEVPCKRNQNADTFGCELAQVIWVW